MQTLRILIADDHAALRRGIRSLLESHANWEVCAEARDGREAVELAAQLKPDVVLLDLTMPHLNGLEAARQIRQELPDASILMLTMHESNQLTEEASRSGANGLISKSDAHGSLLRAIESCQAARMAIHLAGGIVETHRHIGAFFQSAEERYRVLAPFIAEGLARDEKAVHIINPPDRDAHLRHLMEAGIDVDGAEARHQLQFIPWAETYLRDGKFDEQAMLALIQQLLTDGRGEGFPRSRAIAHMEWALEDRPGVADLVEYEARLNYVLPQFSDVVICAYDLTKFSGNLIINVMSDHPALIVGGSLFENPFYTPPDRMIEELGKSRAAFH